MLLIGLTGSIATGKSSVSNLLTSPPHSLPLIDADILARRVVEPGTEGYKRVVAYFGPTTPDLLLPAPTSPTTTTNDQGEEKKKKRGSERPLNRAALGRRVFGDSPEKKRDRAVLNQMIHPRVRWEMYKAILYYYVCGYWAVVLDLPLLFESGLDLMCGAVVVVAVRDEEVQLRRLLERDRKVVGGGTMTREEAVGRVRSQWPVVAKVERCLGRNGNGNGKEREEARGLVIWNDGEKEELTAKVAEVVEKLKRRSPVWWSWLGLLVPLVGVLTGAWQMVRNLLDRWAWERKQKTVKAKL